NGIDYGSSVRVIDSMGRQVYFATSGDFGPGGFIPGATEGEAPDIAGYDCHPVERQYGPPENTVELCSDKLDNDSDGNTDLADATCAPFRAMFPETGMEQCTDHRDNDNNGASDWQESACLQFFHENDALACGDKKDNDHDRREDAADPDCAAYYPLPANLLLEWHEGDVDFAIVNVRVEHVKRATEFTHLYFTLAIKNNSSHTTYAGPPGLTLFVGNTKSKLYLGDFGAVMPGERTYPTVSFALDDNLNSFELSTGGSTDIRFALSGNGGISVKKPPLQPPVVSAPTSTMQVVTSTTSSSTTP
ncbi:MAG: hypothetical protein Q7S28_04280, partial [bacterium]|nr:hypothetical protein [bacterium]